MIAENAAILIMFNGMIPIVRCSGRIASQSVREIQDAFRTLSAYPCECVHVDLNGMQDMDEPCIHALIQGVDTLRARGIEVKLIGNSQRLRALLPDSGRRDAQPEPADAFGGADPYRQADLQLPCLPQSVALIRANIAEMANAGPFTPTEVDDIIMAVGEAAANAVRHGIRFGEECLLRVRCRLGRRGFSVEITDPGEGFDPERIPPPKTGSYQESGLGIYLMRRVMDVVSYTFDARGTTVRLVKRAHSRNARPAPLLSRR